MDHNDSWLDRNRHYVFVTMLVAVLVGGGLFYLRRPVEEPPIEVFPAEPTPAVTALPAYTPTPGMVRVYVTGAVATTDVYVLPQGSIIKDVIKAAGGFTTDADQERINLALELNDQQQIHVPRINEENPPPSVQGGKASQENVNIDSPPAAGGGININTATLEQLDALPGIGPAIGQRIIDYREKIGGFKNVEEITQVSGVGDSTFAKIQESITVE